MLGRHRHRHRRVLMVVATQGFRDEEYLQPRACLERAGIEVVVAAGRAGPCTGLLGETVTAEMALAEVTDVEAFDGVVFVGGSGAREYFDSPDAHRIARAAAAAGRVTAAICIGPAILARAGVLQDRRATCFVSCRSLIREQGGRLTRAMVVRDDPFLTADSPLAAGQFGRELVDMLTSRPPATG